MALTSGAGRINRRARRGRTRACCRRRAPAHGKGGRGAHGRRRHERHKEFNARATRDGAPGSRDRLPTRTAPGQPPVQAAEPSSPGARRVPFFSCSPRRRLIGRLPALIDAADGVALATYFLGEQSTVPRACVQGSSALSPPSVKAAVKLAMAFVLVF